MKGKGRVKAESDEENAVAVTRQCRVGELVVLNDAPEVWDVPHDVYSSRAYLLDFRSCQERLNWKGKTLSIDAYIKRHVRHFALHRPPSMIIHKPNSARMPGTVLPEVLRETIVPQFWPLVAIQLCAECRS